ncbi:MAG: septal ring lytic transglycosylase RlpA family protein, partial [Rubrobacter sp.]|nr:septal ring lytic transglycosylase RlpA family protein [Rubrobacter sp.]
MGAFVLALSIAVVSSAKADAAPATASWYGPGFAGNQTASGEIFNPQAMTAAHKTLPFGTQVEVCYNGCTTVTINDRGPYANGAQYDLSQGAAQAI